MRSLEQQHQRYVQQAAWTKPLRDYLFAKLDWESSWRVLDVGCGTGSLAPHLLAQSSAKVVGVDIHFPSLRFFKTNHKEVQLVQADGMRLPFADLSFQLCLCHYLLLWAVDPLQVLCEMYRVTAWDGYVFILAEPDYGGRIDYPPPLAEIGQLQSQALQLQGADVFIGRKVRGLLHRAGFSLIESGVLGGQWASQSMNEEFDLEWDVLQHDVLDLLSPADLNKLKELAIQAEKNEERVLFVPTFYAAAQKVNDLRRK